MLPIEGNSIQQERYESQLAASEPLKKQLWKQTIIQKIKNQSAVLSQLNLPYDYLIPLPDSKQTKSKLLNMDAEQTELFQIINKNF